MLPTSTLPMTPLLFPAGVGALLGALAVGALVALVVGFVLYRREHGSESAIDVAGGAAATPATDKPARPRLSA